MITEKLAKSVIRYLLETASKMAEIDEGTKGPHALPLGSKLDPETEYYRVEKDNAQDVATGILFAVQVLRFAVERWEYHGNRASATHPDAIDFYEERRKKGMD